MKILYLKPERGRPFFHAEPAEVRVPDAERPAGAVGWVGRKWDEIEERWKDSDASSARWSRKLWIRLHAWCKPDESLLARLATADAIVIRHPAGIPARKVRSAWKRYLRARAGTHWFWFLVDAVLAPITGAVLWILPGPNVVFFWVAYRAYRHHAIVRALHRARWSPPPFSLEADPALDRPIRRDADGGYAHDAIADRDALRDHVERREPADDPGDSDHDHDHDHDPDIDADPDADPDVRSPGRA